MMNSRLSQIISPENAEQFRYFGSLLYMAPEKLLKQSYDSRVDLWSVGIIMYECLFGRPPYTPNIGSKALLDFISKRTPIEVNIFNTFMKYNNFCYFRCLNM